MRQWWSWLLLAVVVVGSVTVAGLREADRPQTTASRIARLSSEVRCPTCEGLSVRDSNAPSSEAIRDVIADRVRSGESDDAIKEYLVSRYGRDILLRPPSRGFGALVWVVPALAVAAAAVGLAFAFRRWRRPAPAAPVASEVG